MGDLQIMFGFFKGEFVDVIEHLDDRANQLVHRFNRGGNAIKCGAKLTVREGQAAVMIHEEQLADTFTPGLYTLETNNMPLMTALQHWGAGFRSPFLSQIYFINTTRIQNLKWGTRNPILAKDSEFGAVRLRDFGTYTIRVVDPARFMAEVVGTDDDVSADDVGAQIRNTIVRRFSNMLAQLGIPVLDMAANASDLATFVAAKIAPEIADYWIEVPRLFIESISLPEDVEKTLDAHTSMGVVGDLGNYTKLQEASAIKEAAEHGNDGMGLGLGVALARHGDASSATPPPPPPVDPALPCVDGSGFARVISGDLDPLRIAVMCPAC